MNKIMIFILGCVVGIAGTLYVVPGVSPDQHPNPISNNNYTEALAPSAVGEEPQQITTKNSTPKVLPKDLNSPQEIELLLNAFTTNTEHLFERQEFKDLAYLIRKDKKVAAHVRNKLLASTSYEEKYALINLLAQDTSKETLDLLTDMIKKPDEESKRLGFELLRSMDIKENQPELNNALLDSIYYESNPELLAEVIFRLSEKNLDADTKTIAIDRFQSFLSSNNNAIKARAIDGLSQLGDQELISSTIKKYLNDSNESVRVAAISAAFKLNPDKFDNEITNSLATMTKNTQEPESVRNMATAVLESRKSAL